MKRLTGFWGLLVLLALGVLPLTVTGCSLLSGEEEEADDDADNEADDDPVVEPDDQDRATGISVLGVPFQLADAVAGLGQSAALTMGALKAQTTGDCPEGGTYTQEISPPDGTDAADFCPMDVASIFTATDCTISVFDAPVTVDGEACVGLSGSTTLVYYSVGVTQGNFSASVSVDGEEQPVTFGGEEFDVAGNIVINLGDSTVEFDMQGNYGIYGVTITGTLTFGEGTGTFFLNNRPLTGELTIVVDFAGAEVERGTCSFGGIVPTDVVDPDELYGSCEY